jgi:hypothetical protein
MATMKTCETSMLGLKRLAWMFHTFRWETWEAYIGQNNTKEATSCKFYASYAKQNPLLPPNTEHDMKRIQNNTKAATSCMFYAS